MRHEVEHYHAGELLCRVFARITPFFFQFRFKRIKSKPIPFNGFVKLGQFVIHDTLLIPRNTEHKFESMDVRLCHGC